MNSKIKNILLLSCLLTAGSVKAEIQGMFVYGFFDLEAEISDQNDAGRNGTFDQHHLNLIFQKQLDNHSRIVSEVEMEHGPVITTNNSSGNVYLAKAFLDYRISRNTVLRVGKFLSPFGIYNERHDATPTFISTKLPTSVYGKVELTDGVTGRWFAKFTTGIMLIQNLTLGEWQGRIKLHMGNGRGAEASEQDDNGDKGFGLRFTMNPVQEQIVFGTSAYTEKLGYGYNSRITSWGLDMEYTVNQLFIESELLLHRI